MLHHVTQAVQRVFAVVEGPLFCLFPSTALECTIQGSTPVLAFATETPGVSPDTGAKVERMTITELRKVLEPLGWRFDGVHLNSPSGGYWVSESDLASPMQVYLPVARRREAVRRDVRPGAQEYDD